ncbi:MAG: hypothetical protein WCE96_05955 [Nitrososphaeraceae archaeon]
MSSTPDQAPKPTGVERTFASEECGGISFKTSEELRKHDREVQQLKYTILTRITTDVYLRTQSINKRWTTT